MRTQPRRNPAHRIRLKRTLSSGQIAHRAARLPSNYPYLPRGTLRCRRPGILFQLPAATGYGSLDVPRQNLDNVVLSVGGASIARPLVTPFPIEVCFPTPGDVHPHELCPEPADSGNRDNRKWPGRILQAWRQKEDQRGSQKRFRRLQDDNTPHSCRIDPCKVPIDAIGRRRRKPRSGRIRTRRDHRCGRIAQIATRGCADTCPSQHHQVRAPAEDGQRHQGPIPHS